MTRSTPFGSVTTGLGRFVRREIQARSETILATVISIQRLVDDDAMGSATWVCDLDVGEGVTVKNANVKAGANGERFYASLGQTVKASRNTQGRFDVIGPGDRIAAITKKKTYVFGNPTPVVETNLGRRAERVPYEFYKGVSPPPTLWNDRVTPYPLVRIVDGDGNPV